MADNRVSLPLDALGVTLPYSTEAYSLYNSDLLALKKELINKVVIDNVDIDTAYAEFAAANGAYMSEAIVISLNAE